MLGWFILGITFLGGSLLLARWFTVAEPRDILRAGKIVGVVLLGALFVFLALSGRLAWALATVPAAVIWVLRFYTVAQAARRGYRAARNFARMGTGTPTGCTSSVETAYLHMTLDHDTGEMAGRVVRGGFEGRELFTLNDADLMSLLAECRVADAESAQVLESYLDRMRTGWRDRGDAGASTEGFTPGAMDEDEALRILGLEPGADADAIKSAHRRLMAALHPDHGGSDYLAAKINQAKDVLLYRG